jgi:hypothetical protein
MRFPQAVQERLSFWTVKCTLYQLNGVSLGAVVRLLDSSSAKLGENYASGPRIFANVERPALIEGTLEKASRC